MSHSSVTLPEMYILTSRDLDEIAEYIKKQYAPQNTKLEIVNDLKLKIQEYKRKYRAQQTTGKRLRTLPPATSTTGGSKKYTTYNGKKRLVRVNSKNGKKYIINDKKKIYL
jgi:hypothetical protein